MTDVDSITQTTIRIRGVVQGVGLRPAIWHCANELGLTGTICNDSEGVLIHCKGTASAIDSLLQKLRCDPPYQARINAIETAPCEQPISANTFEILPSPADSSPGLKTGVSPDLATCPECLQELFDPNNRRYHYPFINCSHCGPRLSIVRAIPYDRANTSMADFPMCADCAREYHDPNNRRFHAQPNACPECGPQLWLQDSAGSLDTTIESTIETTDPIAAAQEAIRQGKIIAIKGVGGFQLVLDATNEQAVARLRQRKNRPSKPLALMARDLDVIHRYCDVSLLAHGELRSTAAPVVLLQQHPHHNHAPLASNLAPQHQTIGIMLPSSPLHQLLLNAFDTPLVMTSGNPSGEPQCIDNDNALLRLSAVADLFLLHNRDISNRVDDSVVQIIHGEGIGRKIQPMRRARGYAPTPLPLPPGFNSPAGKAPDLLAMGSDLKNTFCLLGSGNVILSQHIGDLEDAVTLKDYEHSLALYRQIYQHQPECIAVDAHPDYHSTRVGQQLAQQQQLPIVEVQHHHAHLAACLGEHGWPLAIDEEQGDRVLAITLDGMGYSNQDDSIWGGEILLGNYHQCQRLAHLKPVPLPGGNAAMTQPWRNAVAQLHTAIGWQQVMQEFGDLNALQCINHQPVDTLLSMMRKGLNSPLSSSCGRLFDAVATVLGLCLPGDDNPTGSMDFEGQAAMALEACISDNDWRHAKPYPFLIQQQQIDPAPMWRSLLQDLLDDQGHAKATGLIAARFHKGLAQALDQCIKPLAAAGDIQHVVLSGGVFQNQRLQSELTNTLQQQGFTVLTHRQVPANDGGLALGQALIAAARYQKELAERSTPCV